MDIFTSVPVISPSSLKFCKLGICIDTLTLSTLVSVIDLVTGVSFVTSTATGTVFSIALISCNAVWSDAPFLKKTSTSEKFSSPFAFCNGVPSRKTFFLNVSVPKPPSSKIESISPYPSKSNIDLSVFIFRKVISIYISLEIIIWDF